MGNGLISTDILQIIMGMNFSLCVILAMMLKAEEWHNGAVVSNVTSHQEGSGFEPRN